MWHGESWRWRCSPNRSCRVLAAFDRAWPLDETPCLGALLQAIDEAERKPWRERDARSTGLKEPRGPAL